MNAQCHIKRKTPLKAYLRLFIYDRRRSFSTNKGESKTLKPGIYLEEALKDVLRTSNFVHGMFNLIVAPCGSGKTTAAINVISKLASTPRTALYLIDTTNRRRHK